MDPQTATRSATKVGVITLPIGLALVADPARLGRLLGTGNHDTALRIIGAMDLALVPGLVAGIRPRRWLTARAGLNLLIAGYCGRLLRRGDGGTGARLATAAMVAATISDTRAIAALRPPRSR